MWLQDIILIDSQGLVPSNRDTHYYLYTLFALFVLYEAHLQNESVTSAAKFLLSLNKYKYI